MKSKTKNEKDWNSLMNKLSICEEKEEAQLQKKIDILNVEYKKMKGDMDETA